MSNLFYISTNEVWGGSEKLWYESVLAFLSKSKSVSLAIKYDDSKIDAIRNKLDHFIDLRKRFSTVSRSKRIVNKIVKIFKGDDRLLKAIQQSKPDLIIISQGNNISSLDILELCVEHNLPFVTISQIVTDLNWFWLNADLRNRLVKTYEKAVKNYFVSKDNLDLHEFLLAYTSANSDRIYNPFVIDKFVTSSYPDSTRVYQMAIVGRIECYHKGLDILFQVLSLNKWKKRAVEFNFYGVGPHITILKDLILQLRVNNVFFHGHIPVIEIWNKNHILLMPSRMEGQSLALLEALNLNRTAVVTNVGGALEVVEDNITGFIANVPTVEALDDALERAWNRRFEWEELGIRAGNKMRSVMPEDPVSFFNKKILNVIKDLNAEPV